jgi:hypothetical protein
LHGMILGTVTNPALRRHRPAEGSETVSSA